MQMASASINWDCDTPYLTRKSTSETHLTDKNNFQIDWYCLYDNIHPEEKAHGGIEIKYYEDYCKDHLQATSVEWTSEITITAISCLRKYELTSIFNTLWNSLLVAGDFSAYW